MSKHYQFRRGSIWHKAKATKTVCGLSLRGRTPDHMISSLSTTQQREIREGQGFFFGAPQRVRRCKLKAIRGTKRCSRHQGR